MYTTEQKRDIAEKVQRLLKDTENPNLPREGEIQFFLLVIGRYGFTEIRNNGVIFGKERRIEDEGVHQGAENDTERRKR